MPARPSQCVAVLVLFLTLVAPAHARRPDTDERKELRQRCPALAALYDTQEAADDTARALQNVKIPDDLRRKIEGLIAQQFVDDIHLSMTEAIANVIQKLSATEQLQVAPWVAARIVRDAADADAAAAKTAYTTLVAEKDKAFRDAAKKFKEEQDWLTEQKKPSQGIPRDDAYLDKVSKITERLKASYAKIKEGLDKYKSCFSDVQTFLDDKDERLAKIALLDAEIARRRGGKPADENAKADPAAPGPLGDTFVLDAVEISPKRGKLTSVDATGFAYEIEKDGKKLKAQVKIAKGPPAKIRNNQKVELEMTASGDAGAPITATWGTDNIAGWLPCDNDCSNIPNFKGGPHRNQTTATLNYFFGAHDIAAIAMWGGEYDSRDGTHVRITWKYKKAN